MTVLLEYLLLDCSIGVRISIILYLSMNKTCYGHCHSVLRTSYPLGLPLIELDSLLRVMKEITNIILLFLFHYIQTHAYILCDRISQIQASTHTKSNLRFYQKWIAGLIHYHISHCTSFSTDKSGFCSSFLPTLSKPRV